MSVRLLFRPSVRSYLFGLLWATLDAYSALFYMHMRPFLLLAFFVVVAVLVVVLVVGVIVLLVVLVVVSNTNIFSSILGKCNHIWRLS